MKKFAIIISVLVLAACDSENAMDCLQTAGSQISEEFVVPPFSEIIVWEGVKLFVSQGEAQKVTVETGENLLNEIELKVSDGVLSIVNNNGCNLIRDYGLTKVHVTAPNIAIIRNSSGWPVKSEGVLAFPSLTLLSENGSDDETYHVNGDFNLQLEVQELKIIANGISKFYLSGTVENADIGLYSGDVRVEAADLIVQNLNLYHRSTNAMIVNPQQSIRGQIVSLGDVLSKTRPPIVEVEELYRGRLIFE